MNWFLVTTQWYLYLLILGAIFFPLTKKIFGSCFDWGYPFAKTLAILLLSYSIFILSLIHVAPFSRISLIVLSLLFLGLNVFIFSRPNFIKREDDNPRGFFFIIVEELLFIVALFFLAYVRGQEPSIRGLEKFMDFGFINSILRSKYFPPLDIWLSSDNIRPSGYPINYYYFGHLTAAVLTKLTNIIPSITYNLILATIFAQVVTSSFSFVANLIYFANKKIKPVYLMLFGTLGSFIINLGGNLHTIYIFTSGYPNDNPIPFWQIFGSYNPTKYWYPNATRFIPFTIHEFPAYSYVVADLHGHVFNIPFVFLTLAILLILFVNKTQKLKIKNPAFLNLFQLITTVFLGFLTAVHYMTNAFDGPIYVLLIILAFVILFRFSLQTVVLSLLLFASFALFSFPFSNNFSPFISGIGVNCSPDFLTNIGKIGPFLFEKGNCQVSPPWMLFILWGYFEISFIIFLIIKSVKKTFSPVDSFIFLLFAFSTFLIIIPEFFYIKDIYPAHFRANTMFKLGYQAFMMMGASSVFVLYQIKFLENTILKTILNSLFFLAIFFVSIYSFFSFPSYYGGLNKKAELDGSKWLSVFYPQDKEIIDFLNNKIKGQPVTLEAQGDSYTDYERISAYTGLPTVAGWWVHEWLWRGSANVVGTKIPDIVNIYESKDLSQTRRLISKYKIKYVVISKLEKEKYKNLNEEKFNQLGRKIFVSSNKDGAIYQLD